MRIFQSLSRNKLWDERILSYAWKAEPLFCHFQAHGLSQASLIPCAWMSDGIIQWKITPRFCFPLQRCSCTEILPSFIQNLIKKSQTFQFLLFKCSKLMGFGFQLTLVLFYSCTSISLSFVPLIPLPKNLLFDCELYRNTQTLLQFWNAKII